MEEMIDEVFSINSSEIEQEVQIPSVQLQDEGVNKYDSELVEVMDDVASLVNIAIEDSSSMDTVRKTFDTIKEDFDSFPTILRHRENEFMNVMTDFNSLLEVGKHSSFIKDDFKQAMKVIKKDLNKLRKEHKTRGRFFEQSRPQTLDISTFSSSSPTVYSSTESAHSSDIGKNPIFVPGNVQILPLDKAPKVNIFFCLNKIYDFFIAKRLFYLL